MKTTIHPIPRMSLEDFADAHSLRMEVHERGKWAPPGMEFYAAFTGADVQQGRLLCGTYGDGRTPEEAIANYAKQISEEVLVIDADRTGRREIRVPRLHVGKAGAQ